MGFRKMVHLLLNLLLLLIGESHGFQLQGTKRYNSARRIVKCSADDIQSISSSLFDKINNQLQLKLTDYSAAYDVDKWSAKSIEDRQEFSGTAEWWDETKGSKLTGLARYTISGQGKSSVSIDAWMGPGLMVPHMFLSVGEEDGKFFIETDYYPRGPLPFGSDQNYLELYYTPEVTNNPMRATVSAIPPSSSFYGRLLESPARFSATQLSPQQVSDLGQKHVDRWLAWLASGKPVEARQRAGVNSRDDKLRQFAFRAQLETWTPKVGPEAARKLAGGFTGPLAEAYIGGGS